MASKSGARPERRKKQRIALARGIFARFGTLDVIMIDVSEAGARIEHFTQLNLGRKARFRFEWQEKTIEFAAAVVSCKVHRFAHEEEGATVFQSGLFFTDYVDDAAVRIHEMVTMLVARSLAEQVANARGIGPIIERNMPVFREGVVAGSGVASLSSDQERRIPKSEIVVDRGYVRCTLNGANWNKKWSRSPEQPTDGFTLPAAESADHIDQLCETYAKADGDGRKLIQLLARLSVEKMQETPEPKP
ncbi:MAG TPA: PilZ domain-containing protein [Thermoanaerobaculia bacterium]|nr:PilZ domain-containing protein [Thermoanaerobaculia bacterium]